LLIIVNRFLMIYDDINFFLIAFRSIHGESAFMFVHNSDIRVIESARFLHSEGFGGHRIAENASQ